MTKKKKAIPAKSPLLTKPLKEAFVQFLEYHPPSRINRNLRRMLVDYMMYDGSRESIYIYETLLDLDGFFSLLDVAEDEVKVLSKAPI
jgi:hypothetical protein